MISGWSADKERHDMLVLRLAPEGRLDQSFGRYGVVRFGRGKNDYAGGLTLQDDGKIVVSGRSHNGRDFDGFLLRLSADGTPDNSFGPDGVLFVDEGGDERFDDNVIHT